MIVPMSVLFGYELLICGLAGALGGILFYIYWMVGALDLPSHPPSTPPLRTRVYKFILLMFAGFVVGMAVWWWFFLEVGSGQISVEKVAVISFALGLAGVSASKMFQKLITN